MMPVIRYWDNCGYHRARYTCSLMHLWEACASQQASRCVAIMRCPLCDPEAAERTKDASQTPCTAQVDRYKQLLLKQRDIMIALTARLNERDEQILTLPDVCATCCAAAILNCVVSLASATMWTADHTPCTSLQTLHSLVCTSIVSVVEVLPAFPR